MTIVTIVSKWRHLEEALSGSADLHNFTFQTVEAPPQNSPDLVILDDEYKAVKTNNIIMLGNSHQADLKKPFKLSVLIKLINSKLQRKVITLGQLDFDPVKRSLRKKDAEVIITNKEAELLHFLATHQDKEFSAKVLLHKIWGYSDAIKTNTLDTHLYGLRKSLEAVGVKNLIQQKNGKYKICLHI